ncbi:MAG: hypothetical protein ABI282_06515, partial [Candidatus Baltobacteraceae bacterium]
ILGIAGIACGLLAPDTQTVVGAPGSTVKVDALARTIDFPPMQNEPSQRLLPVGGAFLLRPVPRTVVEVQAFDAAGRHLTVTQPSGSSFLSPVLLMQARQTIAGMNLPYDSFAVPAAHRLVRAVLFTAQEAAQMRGARGNPGAAVLFDVEDESGRSVARGLALARSNETISVAGLALRPNVTTYNATDVVAIPNIFAVMLGLIAISSGAILNATAKTPSRS